MKANMLKSLIFTGFLLGWATTASAFANQQYGAEFAVQEMPTEIVSYQNYAGLSELVSMICDDAIDRFQGFYGSTVVVVEPFKTIGVFQKNKQSELGITIADQMIAMVNNDTFIRRDSTSFEPSITEQQLGGILQEVDGYLRVHINGVNVKGERFSYVANVEMSESIYRSLHTYL